MQFARPRRSFTPSKSARYDRPMRALDEIIRFSPKYNYSRLYSYPPPSRGQGWQPQCQSVVIQVQSITKRDEANKSTTIPSYGVYFGPDCSRNMSGVMSASGPYTRSGALLKALHIALLRVRDMKVNEWDGRYKEVVIMVDSDYVRKCLHQRVWAWEFNGWRSFDQSHGGIRNLEIIHGLHVLISQMEQCMNMSIRF